MPLLRSVFGRTGKKPSKELYLPEPHNDFIFAILAEELGFVGAVTVIILFMLYMERHKGGYECCGYDGSLIAIGITSHCPEAIINIAVVTSTIPTTVCHCHFSVQAAPQQFFVDIGRNFT